MKEGFYHCPLNGHLASMQKLWLNFKKVQETLLKTINFYEQALMSLICQQHLWMGTAITAKGKSYHSTKTISDAMNVLFTALKQHFFN